MKRFAMVLAVTLLGCQPAEERASSDTLEAIDTVKPATAVVATDSTARIDTVGPRRDTGTQTTRTVSPPPPPRTTKRRDSIIGRDSVIPLDPKKPRLDTVKRPPL